MIRLFVAIGSLLVLALLAALVVPPFVNWNQFKDQFETEATRILGQRVEVLGQTSARLLPLPSVTFTDIRVGAGETGEALLTADSFHMDMELAPLLKGDFVVVDMMLDKPRLDVRVDGEGKLNLVNRGSAVPAEFSADDVSVDRISISNGLLRVRDARFDREYIVKDIDLSASARTLAGPWQAEGQVSYLHERVKIAASSGRWQAETNDLASSAVAGSGSRMRLKVEAKPQSQPYDFLIDGPFTVRSGVPQFSGSFQVKPIGSQSPVDRISFARPSRDEALNARLEGTLQLAASGAVVPDFKLRVGDLADPYIIDGSAFANFGEDTSFEISADGQQINLQRLSPQASGNEKVLSLSERLDAVRRILEEIPRFESNGKVFLHLPAVVTGDTVIREVELEASPLAKEAGWRIKNLKAQLPGRTELRADGVLKLEEAYGYEGALVLASRQPSGFASWLVKDVPAVIQNLSSSGFSASTRISPKAASFRNMEIALAGESLLGSMDWQATDGEKRPRLDAKFSGRVVNFEQLSALFNLFSGDAGKSVRHDVTLDLQADALYASGVAASDVVARARMVEGMLSLDELAIGDVSGAAVTATGTLSGYPNKLDGLIAGTLKSANPVALLKLVQTRLGPLPILGRFIEEPSLVSETDIAFDLRAGNALEAIGDNAVALNIGGFSGGSALKLTAQTEPSGDKTMFDGELSGSLTIDNPDGSKLLNQIGIPAVPISDAGGGRFALSWNGTSEQGVVSDIALSAGTLKATAKGVLKPTISGEQISLKGTLQTQASASDFDPLILFSGLPFSGFGEGNSGSVEAEITLDGARITASNIEAKVAEGSWSGKLALDRSSKPRATLTGELSVDQLDAVMLQSLVHTASPNSSLLLNDLSDGDDKKELAPSLLAGLDGSIDLKVNEVSLEQGGERVAESAENVSAQLNIRDGDIVFDDLSGQWLGGVISGTVSLSQTSSARLMNGQLSLTDGDLGMLNKALGIADWSQGMVNANVAFESAGSSADEIVSGLTGSGSLVARDGQIVGLNESALPLILVHTDAQADESTAPSEQLDGSQLAELGLFEGAIQFDEVAAPFAIASGVLRANNVRLINEKVAAGGDVRVELFTGRIDAKARLAFTAGREAIIGAAPEVEISISGQPGQLQRSVDTADLSTFVGMRGAERRERKFESQKSNILERQSILRLARLYNLKEQAVLRAERERLRLEEEARIEQEQQAEQARIDAEKAALEVEKARLKRLEEEQSNGVVKGDRVVPTFTD